MKIWLLSAILLISISLTAQRVEKFYDINSNRITVETARYMVILEKVRKDLWHRQDYFVNERKLKMDGYYTDSSEKALEQGAFTYFYPNGKVKATGNYSSGEKNGLWLQYYSNGMMKDSTVYYFNQPIGTSLSWFEDGYPSDSLQLDEHQNGVLVSWFNNGSPSQAGLFKNGKKDGKWKYYHSTGNISEIELFENGTLISKQYYTESGDELLDTSNIDHQAQYGKNAEGWEKYIYRQLYWPAGMKIVYANAASVGVEFTITETGAVTNIQVTDPFHPAFDDIVVKAIQHSKAWVPAVEHGRKVPIIFKEVVNFKNED